MFSIYFVCLVYTSYSKLSIYHKRIQEYVYLLILCCVRVALELWPDGEYALPRPVYDCPSQALHNWTTGMARIKLRPLHYNKSASSWSRNFHHLGTSEPNELIISTCATGSDKSVASTPAEDNRQVWPEGSYCIYKTSGDCPKGLFLYYGIIIIKLVVIWDCHS